MALPHMMSFLMDAQQNLYNNDYGLASHCAVLGLKLTNSDLITKKLSIGCDTTTNIGLTSPDLGSQPGLDGHNKFESDTSLTRDDYFLADGDKFSFNGTLFE
ncbi:hypothetical protein SBOR_2980 [Sclerotinia borealis F-4128]|uniref:Heme haloperoxidase family profile domain-containing protein n=1 Tax=Sclerotinia borealis (strain F-4128) TaxID=1432307 RepID=W9CKS8_SCLBF|nr:hypothetical protein SBOR_2980 [Sclerotinia borealis F-4128]